MYYYFMSNKKSSVLGRANLHNNTSQNAFDLSHRNLFTSSCGVLLPCMYAETLPGEKFSISNSHFTRAETLVSNSYGRFIETIQAFYVPYSSIFREYPMRVLPSTQTTISGYNENRVATGYDKTPVALSQNLPRISLSDIMRIVILHSAYLYAAINNYGVSGTLSYNPISCSGLPRFMSIARLLMYLGYGDYRMFFSPSASGNSYDTAPTLPFLSKKLSLSTPLYGVIKDNFYYIDFGHSSLKDTFTRLLNNTSYMVSPMRLLAYHKVYNDFFRNDVWQAYSAKTCNLDFMTGLGSTIDLDFKQASDSDFLDAVISFATTKYSSYGQMNTAFVNAFFISSESVSTFFEELSFLDERPLNMPLDAVNSVLPSPQYGNAAKVQTSLVTTEAVLKQASNLLAVPEPTASNARENNLGAGTSTSYTPASLGFTIKDMRVAESLQKYREISASSDNYFVDQIRSHFNYNYTRDPFEVKFLGGDSNTIQIDTQVNQNLADDNNATLGGIASAQGQFTCNGVSDTYGLVLILHSIYPLVDYPNIGLDSQVLTTSGNDVPIPEFDNNGYEGRRLINVLGIHQPYYSNGTSPSSVYGYAPKYFDYKVSKDVANGKFITSMKDRMLGYNSLGDNTIDLVQRTLYASPRLCDNVFANTSHSTIDDDQFYTQMNCGFSIIRPFSVHSLPFAN